MVLNLFSREVIGWRTKPRMYSGLAINALLMPVLRRNPILEVIIHSEQNSQFSSSDRQNFLNANNMISSMGWRGNYHDTAITETYFQL